MSQLAKLMVLLIGMAFTSTITAYSRELNDTELMAQVLELNMINAQYLNNGVYAKSGKNVMYFIQSNNLRDQDAFYATMVQVLSEKYGCFIRSRIKYEKQYNFNCRDGRTVRINHGINGSVQYFSGRQFDRFGQEIIINSASPTLLSSSY